MQVIAAPRSLSFSDRLVLARSVVVATLLVVAGASIAWLLLATPIVNVLIPDGRPTGSQVAVDVLAWAVAIVVPAGLLLIGVARMAETFEAMVALRPRRLSAALRAAIGPEHVAVADLRVPGGRRVNELVLGPFGIVVLGEVPPPSVSRHVGSRWELRGEQGRWIPIESPVERAARDAERVRGWLATDDRDFLVRVYAAVVTDDERVERTPSCAVVPSKDLAGWLGALPAQRGLTADRRGRLGDLMRAVAVSNRGRG